MRFVLASASQARLATLRAAGLDPEVVVSGVDEDVITAESPRELVLLRAVAKSNAVAAGVGPGAVVLGCDSMLELDGVALGKPADVDEARERWRAMRGRTGTLWTGHQLINTTSQRVVARAAEADVRFADVTDDEIAAYVATGEPLHVAGAFTIDGLGGWFVESVSGDPHTVVGVSLPLIRAMLREIGLSLAVVGYPSPR